MARSVLFEDQGSVYFDAAVEELTAWLIGDPAARDHSFFFANTDLSRYEEQFFGWPQLDLSRQHFVEPKADGRLIGMLKDHDAGIYVDAGRERKNRPFDMLPAALHTRDSLIINGFYDGEASELAKLAEEKILHTRTTDHTIWKFHQNNRKDEEGNEIRPQRFPVSLAQSVYDAGVTRHLYEIRRELRKENRDVLGFMGGHAEKRDSEGFRKVAHLALERAEAGYGIVTGGGPGMMEAANLGAYFARYESGEFSPHQALDAAVDMLAVAPDFNDDPDAYISTAKNVIDRFPPQEHGIANVGIPTWKFGHEPPNVFSAVIAKYNSNAQRENVLLTMSDDLIIAPGKAGTAQEVFQRAFSTYYFEHKQNAARYIFVGKSAWKNRPSRIRDTRWTHLKGLLSDQPKHVLKAARWLLRDSVSGDFSDNVMLLDDPKKIARALDRPRDRPKLRPSKAFKQRLVRMVRGSETQHNVEQLTSPAENPKQEYAIVSPSMLEVAMKRAADHFAEQESLAPKIGPVGAGIPRSTEIESSQSPRKSY